MKTIKLIILLVIVATMSFFISCNKSEKENVIERASYIELQPQARAILKQSNSFAIDFFKAVSQQQEDNLFISPYSVSAVLGMLYNGAEGETKSEIAKVLGMSNYTSEDVSKSYYELTEALLAADPKTSLSLANAIWANANKGVTLKESFIDLNKSYYDAEVSTLDFSQSLALKTINDWGNKKTNGIIPEILEGIDPATIVILANAIYFKSTWTDGFDKSETELKPFHNINGSISMVPMMYKEDYQDNYDILYAQMDLCGMVTLPYSNKAFAMNLILPSDGVDLDALIEELDGEYWQAMIAHRASAEVTLFMPSFKIENRLNLASVLTGMGMPLAFSKNANFSNMTDVQASISGVLQKSYISVDEAGTEAAVVTATVMSYGPVPNPQKVTVVLDRPFIFSITEQSTGAILFMGKVTEL